MLYLTNDIVKDAESGINSWVNGYGHPVIIRDTDDEALVIKVGVYDIEEELRSRGIQLQDVVGLFKVDTTLYLTPPTDIELSVLKLLVNPHFEMLGNRKKSSAPTSYSSFGFYNFCTGSLSRWAYDNDRVFCSVARLLLDNCGSAADKMSFDSRLETTRESIGVCVDSTPYQTVYLRFDISNYTRLNRAYSKWVMLNMSKDLPKTMKVNLS